jgi:hypothetical protein
MGVALAAASQAIWPGALAPEGTQKIRNGWARLKLDLLEAVEF